MVKNWVEKRFVSSVLSTTTHLPRGGGGGSDLGTDYYFLEGGGVSNFPKKTLHSQNGWKNNRAEKKIGKYFLLSLFWFLTLKNSSAETIAHEK